MKQIFRTTILFAAFIVAASACGYAQNRKMPVIPPTVKQTTSAPAAKPKPKQKPANSTVLVESTDSIEPAKEQERIISEKVTDAPKWFFNPPKDEYIGVSLPLKNQKLAQQQAICAALLSYVAQNKTEINFKGFINSYEGNENSKWEGLNTCKFKLFTNYQVIKTAINQYGEHFVSLKVKSDKNSSIEVNALHYSLNTEKNGITESSDSLKFYILQDSMMFLLGREHTQNSETSVEYNVKAPSANETFVNEKTYSYSPTANSAIKSKWSSSSVKQSLGAAYMSALLIGIMQDSSVESERITTKILSSKAAITDSLQIADESAEGGFKSELYSENIVTKPARVITAGIDTKGLILFTVYFSINDN